MGYLLVLILGVVLVGVVIATLLKQGSKSMKGQLPGEPVGQSQPAADEPTPGASSTSSATQVQSAQQHTPPA